MRAFSTWVYGVLGYGVKKNLWYPCAVRCLSERPIKVSVVLVLYMYSDPGESGSLWDMVDGMLGFLWIIYSTMYPVDRIIIYMIRLDNIDCIIWYCINFSFWFFCKYIFIRTNKNKRKEKPFWPEVVNIIFSLVNSFKSSFLFMLSVESEKVDGIHILVVKVRGKIIFYES